MEDKIRLTLIERKCQKIEKDQSNLSHTNKKKLKQISTIENKNWAFKIKLTKTLETIRQDLKKAFKTEITQKLLSIRISNLRI
jgi:hypothetical protein